MHVTSSLSAPGLFEQGTEDQCLTSQTTLALFQLLSPFSPAGAIGWLRTLCLGLNDIFCRLDHVRLTTLRAP